MSCVAVKREYEKWVKLMQILLLNYGMNITNYYLLKYLLLFPIHGTILLKWSEYFIDTITAHCRVTGSRCILQNYLVLVVILIQICNLAHKIGYTFVKNKENIFIFVPPDGSMTGMILALLISNASAICDTISYWMKS